MRRPFGLPLAVSVAGHCCILLALILFLGRIPLQPLRLARHKEGIVITLAPPPPPAPPKPAPPPPPIPELAPPPPPVVRTVPPPPAHHERRAVVRRPPPAPLQRPPPRYQPPPPTQYVPPPPPVSAVPRPAPPPQPAAPRVSAGYQAALSGWLAEHKHYPESARESGEQGEALLRFRVDRSGRVLSYQIVRSTGYPDLDGAVDAMMRGAALPPFPSGMTANNIEVTVAVRFSLVR